MLEVQQPDGSWRSWSECKDFWQARPNDRYYTLDSITGELSFGPFIREPDGTGKQYGAIPVAGSQLRFKRYRSGGGSRGNIKAGDLTILKTAVPYVHQVTNRQVATGGRNAESLERAKLRAGQQLRTSERAVTVEDYEFLAMEASSGVARARCLQPGAVGASPALPAGVVRVLLVPQVTPADGYIDPDRLRVPDRVIKEVQRDLDKRRLLTTKVEIGEPEYRQVAANVRAKLSREADPKVVQNALEAQLNRFLNPLVGGVDGEGWPFGATLHISQIYATLQAVPGIDYIERVNLRLDGSDEPRDSIAIAPNALIASAKHTVTLF
jgi:predicted phage baseplate assembly protein